MPYFYFINLIESNNTVTPYPIDYIFHFYSFILIKKNIAGVA